MRTYIVALMLCAVTGCLTPKQQNQEATIRSSRSLSRVERFIAAHPEMPLKEQLLMRKREVWDGMSPEAFEAIMGPPLYRGPSRGGKFELLRYYSKTFFFKNGKLVRSSLEFMLDDRSPGPFRAFKML